MVVAFLAAIILGSLSAQAQGTLNFNWTENKGDNTGPILTTSSVTNYGSDATTLGPSTSWTIEFTLNNSSLNIARQNITPTGPNAGSAYFAGPVVIQPGGTSIIFAAWLNSSAQSGSSESIYNILVNGIALPQTITANSTTPFSQFQYFSNVPIVDVKLDYIINAVAGSSETGIGISMPAPVPEPSTLTLLGIAGMTTFFFIRKK